MVKKSRTDSAADDSQFANAVRHSAAQIWQAGLGAFAKAQQEGNRMFSRLVKEGTALQAGEKLGGVPEAVSKMASEVRQQAAGSLDKLEQVFEDRVARALARMGVPTLQDIEALSQRVEALSRQVAELGGATAGAAKPARARKTASARATVASSAATGGAVAQAAPSKGAATKAPPAKPAATKRAPARKVAAKPAARRPPAKAAAPAGKPAAKRARKPGGSATS